ncbi:MAG: hypothetical protein WCX22_00015 [Methanoregula sp.]
MNLPKTWVVLLTLLLAAMAMVPMVSAETISAQTNIAAMSDESGAQKDGTIQKLPDFMPSIKDKVSYEEMQRLMKNYTPPPPVPESDMARIIFSKSWFTQNDKDPRADRVQLTFPVAWLDNPPVTDGEAVVLLRVPKRVLKLDDMNPDPGMITVSYPDMYFREFSNLMMINLTSQAQKINLETDLEESDELSAPTVYKSQKLYETDGIDRQVRAIYVRDPSYSVNAVTGRIGSGSFTNKGETFLNYDEHEIYLDRSGDVIEFIIQFSDTGQSFAWVAVYDEGNWVTPWDWLNIELTGLSIKLVDYKLYILSGGVYDIWLYDYDTNTWHNIQYNDTDNPSTIINQIMGSTELDTVGGISKNFFARSTRCRVEETRSGTTWYWAPETFDWWNYTPDEQYVQIESTIDEDNIITIHRVGDEF